MDADRRALLLALALAPWVAHGHGTHDGSPYTTLSPPQPVEQPDRIEVLEFFWYGCPHCHRFEPLLEAWLSRQAPDVAFRRVPAVFNARWARDAVLFYALDAQGLLPRLHRLLFDGIHRAGLRTDDPAALARWLHTQGVDPRRNEEVQKSFGVQSRARRAEQLSKAYGIEGVPTMAVHGRHTVSVEQGGGFEGLLATTDKLVGEARKRPARGS